MLSRFLETALNFSSRFFMDDFGEDSSQNPQECGEPHD